MQPHLLQQLTLAYCSLKRHSTMNYIKAESDYNILVMQADLLEQLQSRHRVAELSREQEVGLAHSVAHVLRTEEALVRLATGLYGNHLARDVVE